MLNKTEYLLGKCRPQVLDTRREFNSNIVKLKPKETEDRSPSYQKITTEQRSNNISEILKLSTKATNNDNSTTKQN